VAATRAKDHLVLSTYRREKDTKSGAAIIATLLECQQELWDGIPEFPMDSQYGIKENSLKKIPDMGQFMERRDNWINNRNELLSWASKPVSVPATRLAQITKEELTYEEPWRKGRGGTSLGRAVHAVLQTIDIVTGNGMEETSRAQADAESISHRHQEVSRLVKSGLESNIVRRAISSNKMWREVPVAIPLDGGVLEGFIDLLFEENNEFVIVDYKTDYIGEDDTKEAVNRYRLQGGAYALAIERVTRKRVKEIVYLFLEPKREVSLIDVGVMSKEAEKAALSYFQTSGLP